MNTPRRVPPAWVLSIPVATFGMVSGFVIVTLPQILAALGVPGGHIATAVAVITSPGFWVFLIAPFLDVRFRRRTYSLVFGLLAVCATVFTVLYHPSQIEIEAVMIIGYLSLALYGASVGGWTGALINKDQSSKLGAWNTVFNICSGGLGILISGYVTQRLSPDHAAMMIFVVFLAPMLTFLFIPAPPPDDTLASESFVRFSREVVSLLKRREILVALTMFLLPSASFALTNTLGGWGKDFHASPGLVSLFGGIGGILAGIFGSFLIPPIAKKVPLRPMYLAVGIIGASFTLSLLLLPRVPATYGLAFLGENIFQAAAFSTAYAIIFEVIGKGNPLAATTFALLTNAMNLPIVYMEFIDGHGFDWHGVAGAFAADALVSGGICVLLWIVLFRILRVQSMHPTAAPQLAAEAK
jgi:PAT family beta-lactamase induction signal transducer AmpG